MILDGKDNDDRELIASYKYNINRDENKDELIIFYKNENNNGKEIKIKLLIINKTKDMNEIIKREELD